MMRTINLFAVLFFVALRGASAQIASAQTARPAYEAAEITVNTSGDESSHSDGSRSQIVMTNQTLKRLIERAYDVTPVQVSGPDWLEHARFDIAAKYPLDVKREDQPLMLRTLLEDRLKLAVHRETREMSGYALGVAKSGFKLKPVEPGGTSTNSSGGLISTLSAKKVSMARLAALLTQFLGQTVVDSTGIDGVYDFDLKWTKDDLSTGQNKGDSDAPSLFTALQEGLGLRLQARKVPVEVIVVDRVERVPSEN